MPHRLCLSSVHLAALAALWALVAACAGGSSVAAGAKGGATDAPVAVEDAPAADGSTAHPADAAVAGDSALPAEVVASLDTPGADLPTFVPKDTLGDDAPADTAEPDGIAGDVAANPVDSQLAPDAPANPAAPWAELDEVALVIVAGDSVAAGYNASAGNGSGGQGFARMVHKNHAAWPKYTGHDVVSAHPKAAFVSVAKSGAQSGEALAALKGAIGSSLPKTVAGDVLLLINVGGNDFNDSQTVMISTAKTATMVQALRKNVADMVQLARKQYEVLPAKRVLAVVNGVHDPTDGKGSVPPNFTAGFCKALSNPALPMVKDTVFANLGTVNAGLKAEAQAQGALFVDLQAAFLGHGVNSGSDCWIDKDCVHPTNPGHDLIRRKVWLAMTGVEY